MREFKDVLLLAGILLGALLVLFLVQLGTAPVAAERERARIDSAVEAVAGEGSLGERREIGSDGVLSVTPVTSPEEGRGNVVELEVAGYRGRIRYVVRLDWEGKVTGVRLVSEQESPQVAEALGNSRRVLSLLSGEAEARNREEQIVVEALEDGVRRARRQLGSI